MKYADPRMRLLRDLSRTWVLQRLRRIELSAIPEWIGSRVAVASRYQHSLSVGKLSLLVSGGDKDDLLLLTAASTLHDVGAGPFPHLSDQVMKEILGFPHEGAVKFAFENSPLKDSRILEKYGLDLDEVASIVEGSHRLSRFLHGLPDLDNADNIYRFIISIPGRPLGEPSYAPQEIARLMSLKENLILPDDLRERWISDFRKAYSYLRDNEMNMIGWTMLGRALRLLRDDLNPDFFRLTNKEAYWLIKTRIPKLVESLERREFQIIFDRKYAELKGEAQKILDLSSLCELEQSLSKESNLEEWMVGLSVIHTMPGEEFSYWRVYLVSYKGNNKPKDMLEDILSDSISI
ncbi:HD domain-containing protein [Candidatus Bathyarchaeota archaeon]|nr:HD domain-containing protein [Candidatus Bathyarchaeota archaeon]